MRARARAALVVAAALVLSGCTPAGGSFVAVAYERDGTEHTVTMRGPEARCNDSSVAGISAGDPVGQYSFLLPVTGRPATGTGAIADGDGLLAFTADEIDLGFEREGVVTVPETPATVTIWADRETAAPDFDPEDGIEVDGTVTARLICE